VRMEFGIVIWYLDETRTIMDASLKPMYGSGYHSFIRDYAFGGGTSRKCRVNTVQ